VRGALQLELYAAVQDLLIDRLIWFLRNVELARGLADIVEHYRAGISSLRRSRRRFGWALGLDPPPAVRPPA
jgi:glutamate dehydrogenase